MRVAEADLPKLIDTLWGLGYYEASVSYDVAGARIGLGTPVAAAIRAAAGYQGRALVPVKIVARLGPQFVFRRVSVLDATTGAPFPAEIMPPRTVKLAPGDPAHAGDVVAAEARIVDRLRGLGHPFADVVRRTPVVDHSARAFDITLVVEAGPKAALGAITTRGLTTVDPGPVSTFIYAEPGDPYSPTAIEGIRKSLGKVEILGGVRVREGKALDANGNLPIDVELTERKPRALGASAAWSTIDGPELRTYWAHRNLFGQRRRCGWRPRSSTPPPGSAATTAASPTSGSTISAALRRHLREAGAVEHAQRLPRVQPRRAQPHRGLHGAPCGGDLVLRHRWSDTASAQAGLRVDHGQTSDPLGRSPTPSSASRSRRRSTPLTICWTPPAVIASRPRSRPIRPRSVPR